MRRTALLAIASSVLFTGSGAFASTAHHTKVISDCVHARYKPSSIIVACGDGNFALTKISYTSWGAREAKGSDRTRENTCNPNCADGTFVYHHDHFTLYRPRMQKGVLVFTRVKVYRHGTLYQTDPLA